MSYQGPRPRLRSLQKADPQSPYVSALVADTRVQRRQYRSGSSFTTKREAVAQPARHPRRAGRCLSQDRPRRLGRRGRCERERRSPPADCKAHPAECQFAGGHDLQILKRPARGLSPETLYWQAKAANELALQAFFRLGQLPPSAEMHQLEGGDRARRRGSIWNPSRSGAPRSTLAPGNPRLAQELAVSLFMAQDYQAALDRGRKRC